MNTHFCSSFVALFQRMTVGHEEPWRLAALAGALARSTRNMAAASASAKCLLALSLRIVTNRRRLPAWDHVVEADLANALARLRV